MIDLEWNQCPTGEKEVVEFPFEIVEIGAVKLDENRNFVDEFHELVCPQVYKELHPKTNEIIHIDIEELKKGSPFCEVMKRFLNWCGNDYSFATWGMTDLFEIQRNMTYYQMEPLSNKPFFYYDIQKLFSLQTEGKKNARTLEYAVDYWAIEKNDKFHRALWDAEYTAKVFQKIDSFLVENYFSIDYYHNPKTEQEEVFVSMERIQNLFQENIKAKKN